MADATADTAAPDVSLTPEQLSKYIAMLHLGQGLPNVQPDQTPVDTSGFWGGLRHGISLLGEAAGSPGPETLKALSPKEREQRFVPEQVHVGSAGLIYLPPALLVMHLHPPGCGQNLHRRTRHQARCTRRQLQSHGSSSSPAIVTIRLDAPA